MAHVSRGTFHATARIHKILGWVIEIWEDGVAGPVDTIECAKRPTYTDKLSALNALIGRRADAKAADDKWEDWKRRADEEEARRYRK